MQKGLLIAIIATAVVASTLVAVSMRHHEKQAKPSTAVYDSWVHWKRNNQKQYGKGEEALRFAVYANNHEKVHQHNANPNKEHTKALNQFADLSTQEFKARYLTLNTKPQTNVQALINTIADSVDWRTKGAVTDVKDQGQCGSCWAFSTTGSLESAYALKNGKQELFSEQQLVDCSTSYGNQGCNGGLMDQAFQFVIEHGITTEDKYKYKAVDGKCKTPGGDFKISKFVDVPAGDADALASAVNLQPVSIAVDAENWQFYSSGVFSDCSDNLDHGVLLVGYTADAWIVKNSWAAGWGENGYIRVKRGNTCGIANAASYPTI